MDTERVLLRRFDSSDFSQLKEMLQDIEVMKFTGFGRALEEDHCHELHLKWQDDKSVWAAVDKENGELIGWFMLKYTVSHEYPEIGFMIRKSYWGQGLSTETSKRILEYAQNDLRVEQVMATVNKENIASIRVLEKLEMKETDEYPQKEGVKYFKREFY